MVSLSDYGEVWAQYTGKGTLGGMKDSRPCDFEAGQLHNGNCYLICHFDTKVKNLAFDVLSLYSSNRVDFTGTTSELEEIRINTRCLIMEENVNSDLVEGVEHKTILLALEGPNCISLNLSQGAIKKSEWQFSIVNLQFDGTNSSDDSRLDTINLQLENSRIQIVQNSDYADIRVKLRRLKGPFATSKMILTDDELTKESAIDLVQLICNLLTVAQGSYISWLDINYVADDGIQYREHFSNTTLPRNTFQLLGNYPTTSLPEFIVMVYPQYKVAEEIFDMLGIVQMYADARGGGFLDSMGLLACSTVEVLSKQMFKYAHDNRLEYPAEEKYSICFNEENKNKKSKFCIRLSQLVEHYRAPISAKEIKNFVDGRNSLAHELKFLSQLKNEGKNETKFDEKYDDYIFLLSVLERILLSILKYDNKPYNDIRQFSNSRQREMQTTFVLTDFHPDTD